MPTQHPHHVSRLAFRISGLFRISSLGFRISPDPSGRIMRNKPNFTHRQHHITTIYEKQTQSQPPPPTHNPKIRNEPNFTPQPSRSPLFMRNEPNLPPRTPCPRLFAVLSLSKGPKNAKRTQFPQVSDYPNLHSTFSSLLSPLSRAAARATQFTTAGVMDTQCRTKACTQNSPFQTAAFFV